MNAYLLTPAMGLRYVSWWLLLIVRCKEWRDFSISEEVVEPRPDRKVINRLSGSFFTIFSHQPPVRAAHVAALAMGMLVVGQLGMFAVDEGNAVVGACFYLSYPRFAHLFEEVLRQGPRSRVGVRGQQQKEQVIHRFRRSIRHLHVMRTYILCAHRGYWA